MGCEDARNAHECNYLNRIRSKREKHRAKKRPGQCDCEREPNPRVETARGPSQSRIQS